MRNFFAAFLLLAGVAASAQNLQPGFDGREYLPLLSMAFSQADTMPVGSKVPPPAGFERVYRSPVLGLDNRWDLWISKDNKTAVISIRGTTGTAKSWLENFHAPMVPASGSIKLNDSVTFNYQLAADKKAAVHLGWLIGLGHLAPSIEGKIKEYYAKGVKNFIISGHSQGGALAFLTRSYLQYQVWLDKLPKDIIMKTYCSAAPKPGNLYYAYDYDFITRGGWGFNVVNAADWVPETPFSLQQLTDYNVLNPFPHIPALLKKQKFFVRLYVKSMYNRMERKSRKSERKFEKYLGKRVGKMVKRYLPQLEMPAFVHTMNYMRAGQAIILMPDAEYYKEFTDDVNQKAGVFTHHLFAPYYSLALKWYGDK